MHECPQCGTLMQYQEPDPDVGIEAAWVCPQCDTTTVFDPAEDDE
jgi:rubredoxin